MSSIYDAHRAAFRSTSAFVVLKDGERVATVALKFGTAVTAYVHWIGVEMVKGRATGGGYDMQSAAVASAAKRIPDDIRGTDKAAGRETFVDAAGLDDGYGWLRNLEKAGFTVFQAV